tara:strand:+ start:142 stop:606 length:465 start_codon:yes stop_codon:yes gene_type:complete
MLRSFKNHKIYISLIFFILVGCKLQEPLKTHGIIYLENRSKKIDILISNKNDVIKIMGKPQIQNIEDGETWIYIERILSKGKYHKLGKHVLKENNILILSFNKYGIVNEKELLTKEDIKKLKFSTKVTENQITRKSFVQNFLKSIKQKMYSNKK